jgi:oligopeptide transport system substrate-binding protein
MLTRLFPLGATLIAAALLVTGCGKTESKSGAAPTSAAPTGPRTVLNFGNGTEPQDLDPQIVTGVPENKIVNALFEGLVAEGPSGADTIGGVAERWDISEDGRTYTFHLRADAKWSNGDPVTAQDFVASYKRILTPALASEYAYKLHPAVGAEDYNKGKLTDFSKVGFKAADARTLVVTLNNRTPFLIEAMKHYSWFPVHIPTVEKFGGLARKGTVWTRPENMVGNGAEGVATEPADRRHALAHVLGPCDREAGHDQLHADREYRHGGAHVSHGPSRQNQRTAEHQDRHL